MDLELFDAIIGANDLLIVAPARCLGLTLMTSQDKKLERVTGLSVLSWAV